MRALLCLLCLVGLGTAARAAEPPGRPNGNREAARLYDEGRRLLEDLQYEEAIRVYEQLYKLAPHPNVLFQIALAHERTLNFGKALEYYGRYLAEAGEHGAKVATARLHRDWILQLPARITVTSNVRSAVVTLTDLAGGQIYGGAVSEELRVPAGTYLLEVGAPGHVPYRRRVVAEYGQPYNFSAELPQQVAHLQLELDPPDARIFLDSRFLGTGRNYNARQPVGFYNLRLEHPERGSIEGAVELKPGEKVTLQLTLPARVRSGRPELYTTGVLFGGFLVTATLFSADVSTAFVVLPSAAAGGALGLLGTDYLLDTFYRDAEPSQGTASFIAAGPLWGAVYGVAIFETIDAASEVPFGTSATPWRYALGGSLVGFALTTSLAGPVESTPGDSALIHSGAGWGTLAGLIGARATGPADDDDLRRAEGPLLLAGISAGLAAGLATSAYTEWSREHVFWLDVSILAGLAGGAAVERVVTDDPQQANERTARFALAGGVVGLGTGLFILRNYDRSRQKGRRRLFEWLHPTALIVPDARGGSRVVVGAMGAM